MSNELKLGDKIQTPRFLTVRIAAMFENGKLAEPCGFTEPTHYESPRYDILGKSLGNNRIIFGAVEKEVK